MRSIEGYFVSQFNKAQDEIADLKKENEHLRVVLKEKKTNQTKIR